MALNPKQLEELKGKLLEGQKEIAGQLKKLGGVPDFGSDTEGSLFDEEADEAEELHKNLGEAQTLKERLLNIKNALDKMHKGTYGKCEECDKEIEYEVLNVDPESRWCKAHKK